MPRPNSRFLPPNLLTQSYPQLDNDLALMGSVSVIGNQARILRILEDCPDGDRFWQSEELLSCPFVHCRASLMAADIFYYPSMILRWTRYLDNDEAKLRESSATRGKVSTAASKAIRSYWNTSPGVR